MTAPAARGAPTGAGTPEGAVPRVERERGAAAGHMEALSGGRGGAGKGRGEPL